MQLHHICVIFFSKRKTSIRYFNKKPFRSRWDEESSSWLVCAIDIIDAVVETKNPRIYWYTLKRRHSDLVANCKQLNYLNSIQSITSLSK